MPSYYELQETVRSALKEVAKAKTAEERSTLLLKARELTEAALQLLIKPAARSIQIARD